MAGVGIGAKTTFQNEGVTQQTGITAVDTSVVDTTYGQQEVDVITDMRTKVNSVIDKLEAVGLFASA